ncbi:MAG: hypothetical protein J6B47_02160, partial [Prevotella sp.]|nr:hypothetical protein [Prevotella sp.]
SHPHHCLAEGESLLSEIVLPAEIAHDAVRQLALVFNNQQFHVFKLLSYLIIYKVVQSYNIIL